MRVFLLFGVSGWWRETVNNRSDWRGNGIGIYRGTASRDNIDALSCMHSISFFLFGINTSSFCVIPPNHVLPSAMNHG